MRDGRHGEIYGRRAEIIAGRSMAASAGEIRYPFTESVCPDSCVAGGRSPRTTLQHPPHCGTAVANLRTRFLDAPLNIPNDHRELTDTG